VFAQQPTVGLLPKAPERCTIGDGRRPNAEFQFVEHLRSDMVYPREAVLHLKPAPVLACAKDAGLCVLQQLSNIVDHAASRGAQRIFVIQQAPPPPRGLELPGMPGPHLCKDPVAVLGRERCKEQAVVEDVVHQEGFHRAWELSGRRSDRLRNGNNPRVREQLSITLCDPTSGACVRFDNVECAEKLARGEAEPNLVLEAGTDLDENAAPVEGILRKKRRPDRSDPQIPAVGYHRHHIIDHTAKHHNSATRRLF
jgi:hypothetical protein